MTATEPAPLELVDRVCTICGTAEHATVLYEARYDASKLDAYAFSSRKIPEYMHFRLLRCGRCDLVYASPAPDPKRITREYEEAAYDSGVEATFAARTYAKTLRTVVHRLPDKQGALDVGTGNGTFLKELLDLGFTGVRGVEPSKAPVAAAAPEVRDLIRLGAFAASDFEPASFSLVSCFQTLEHLYDPGAFVRDAMALVKPGGAVFVVDHDIRAPLNRALAERSPIFDIEHLQLFSKASLKNLLEGAGLVDVSVKAISNTYPLRYWLRLFPLGNGPKRSLTGALESIGLADVPMAMPVGNMAGFGFKPLDA